MVTRKSPRLLHRPMINQKKMSRRKKIDHPLRNGTGLSRETGNVTAPGHDVDLARDRAGSVRDPGGDLVLRKERDHAPERGPDRETGNAPGRAIGRGQGLEIENVLGLEIKSALGLAIVNALDPAVDVLRVALTETLKRLTNVNLGTKLPIFLL